MKREALKEKFHQEMVDIYKRALKECKYNATRFLQMITEYRGYEIARRLLYSDSVSDGFTALWEMGRLDLAVETKIVEQDWEGLFSDEEIEIARKRLKEYGYIFQDEGAA